MWWDEKIYIKKYWKCSGRTSCWINADIWAITCTRWLALHISITCYITWHSFYSRWQSIDAIESSCTTLSSIDALGKLLYTQKRMNKKKINIDGNFSSCFVFCCCCCCCLHANKFYFRFSFIIFFPLLFNLSKFFQFLFSFSFSVI